MIDVSIKKSERVVIFCHWDKDNLIDDYVVTYLESLVEISSNIVFVSNCEISVHEKSKISDLVTCVLTRENRGYDFSAWKYALDYLILDNIAKKYKELILVNDSCYGGLFPLSEMFNSMSYRACDFWGVTENRSSFHKTESGQIVETSPHVQSYFLVFKSKVLQSKVFSAFWSDLNIQAGLDSAIVNGEVGLSSQLLASGFRYSVYFSRRSADAAKKNLGILTLLAKKLLYGKYASRESSPSIFCWAEMLDARCPVLKRKVFSVFIKERACFYKEFRKVIGCEQILKQSGSSYPFRLVVSHLKRVSPWCAKWYVNPKGYLYYQNYFSSIFFLVTRLYRQKGSLGIFKFFFESILKTITEILPWGLTRLKLYLFPLRFSLKVKPNFQNKSLVCVLGMHRSGTSAITGLLNKSGIYIGEQDRLLPAQDDNLKGFYENDKICRLNQWLFMRNCTDWDCFVGFNKQKLSWLSSVIYLRAVAAELELLFKKHVVAGVKDPRLCLLLPMWRTYFSFKKIVVLHIVRHPMEVALSLEKRDGFSVEQGLAIWERHVRSQLYVADGLDSLVVLHSKLMQQPLQEMQRVRQFMQSAGLDILSLDEQQMNEFISPELFHNKCVSESELSSTQKALWEFCQKLSNNN